MSQYFLVKRSINEWIIAFQKKLRSLQSAFVVTHKPPGRFTRNVLFSLLIQLIFIWILSGFFILQAPMEAIVTRWGHYQRTLRSGIHWHIRFIEKVFKLEVGRPNYQSYTLSALTSDANLVSATVEIEFIINNSRTFLFGIGDPQQYFSEAVISIVNKTLNNYSLTALLSPKMRFVVQKEIQEVLKAELSSYPIGISLLGVSLPMLQPPLALKKNFDHLQKVQEEAEKIESEAKRKATELQNQLELQIQALYEKANTEKYEIIARAQMETSRFLALLTYYEKYPQITIQRLHNQKVEKLLKNRSKVLLIQPRRPLDTHGLPIQLSIDPLLNEAKKDAPVST